MKRGSVVTGPADAEHRSLHSWHVLIRMSALRYKVMQAYTITIRTPPVLQRVFLAISVRLSARDLFALTHYQLTRVLCLFLLVLLCLLLGSAGAVGGLGGGGGGGG